MKSPYDRGGYNNGSYGRLNRNDTLLDDAYYRRDPYAKNDPYARKDPYINNTSIPVQKEKWYFFWFWLKREIQLLFNAEAGSQEQDLVYPIEEDFMKLKISSKFFSRNIMAFFLIIFGFVISMVILGQIDEKYANLKFIIAFLYFFLILYLLYLPTHQIVTSFEYTIYRNVKDFYKRIAILFRSYRNSIIFALVINLFIGAIVSYKPELLHFVIHKDNFIFEFFKAENTKSAYNLLAAIIVFSLILYVFFYKMLFNIAEKNRMEHIKASKRKKSEFYKYSSFLDEE